ncbi:hypothetical protein EYF80_006593 [Liparis tanakae]|uniref:Uncharacterized protein n=1 Tax=Liparis tanakae TaxID=230148 RepID=A0A4Z2IYM4_9TELE|nr:hypothetical protein EYF80_006593 [Liparis tanakae]
MSLQTPVKGAGGHASKSGNPHDHDVAPRAATKEKEKGGAASWRRFKEFYIIPSQCHPDGRSGAWWSWHTHHPYAGLLRQRTEPPGRPEPGRRLRSPDPRLVWSAARSQTDGSRATEQSRLTRLPELSAWRVVAAVSPGGVRVAHQEAQLSEVTLQDIR